MAFWKDRCFTPEQIREAERIAMTERGIKESELIAQAAKNLEEFVASHCESPVAVLAGRGNNGADAKQAAEYLAKRGMDVEIFDIAACTEAPEIVWENYKTVLDGMFGIGLNREVTGIYKDVINSLNAARRNDLFVVSVDVPSGIDAKTGTVLGTAVQADMTITFTAKKTGLSLYPGRIHVGRCIVADAGVPADTFTGDGYRILSGPQKLPERDPMGHKGTFGKIILIAGSETGPGAAVLCAKACYRSGAGLCKLVTPKEVLAVLLSEAPETVYCERKRFLADPDKEMLGYGVRLIGPGLGTDTEAKQLLHAFFEKAPDDKAVSILDADALNLLSAELTETTAEGRIRELAKILPKRCIVTPHMMELSRLLGMPVSEIAKDRVKIGLLWASLTDVVLVMKDAATVIAGDGTLAFNETGNNGMGTAGSGDVLAGILAALSNEACRNNLTPAECANAAVALHGTAGDLAASDLGCRSLTAGDLVRYIPRALGKSAAPEKGTEL